MRMKFLRATEDTTVVLVYPTTLQQYRQAFGILGGSEPAAEKEDADPAPEWSRPLRMAYVVTSSTQRHLWGLPDLAVSGRDVVDEARALELLQDAARRPWAVDGLFPSPSGAAGSRSSARASAAPWIDALRLAVARGGAGVDCAVTGGLDAAGLPADVREAVSKRLAAVLESGFDRAETEIGRAELALALPWSIGGPQRFDRDHVARTLDAAHAAHDGAKEGIVRFLASCPQSRDLLTFEGPCPRPPAEKKACPALIARAAAPGPGGSVLCLAGPAGIGKTSLAKAVARALGRKCVSVSLAGKRTARLIRGFRSAGAGSIIGGLRGAGVNNPVFILEAVDRVPDDGDDVGPLLGLLDPARRADFRDEYLSAPVDLRGVLWIATATDVDAVPERLRAFLTVIELPPYTEREKLEIATRHFLTRPFACRAPAAGGVLALESPPAPPAAADAAPPSSAPPRVFADLAVSSAEELESLWSDPSEAVEKGAAAGWRTAASRGDVRFEPDAVIRIIREYTDEAGVTQLEARLAEACRRVLPLRSPPPAVVGAAGLPALLAGGGPADALPPAVRQAIATERERLRGESKGDLTLTNTWIEWLEHLPWTKRNDVPIELARTREVLDAAQAGLDDAKERIIEYLAVRRRNPGGAGAVLCLLGPPGVGKTSLAQAVARALGRAFVKLPCGGLRDETCMRGHNRTWHKAQPGSILRELRRVGYRDPVFVLDEVDKIGPDPAAVLLEVLDPEQNARFRDSFVELPFDLSEICFITTANAWDRIPAPLRDRLEVVELPGYAEDEKVAIAKSHLVPVENRAAGLIPSPVEFTDGALREIVRGHTREPGIRQFNRCVKALCRKVALGRETGDAALDRARITVREVRRWLGAGAGADDALDGLHRRLDAPALPPEVRSKGRQVSDRLSASGLAPADPEYVRLRTYLACLADLPWNREAVAEPDLAGVRAELDRTHAGLDAAKERLLDHVAAHLLAPGAPGPVLCLKGPGGVGKTSLARAFAAALGRPCAWIECGELADAAALLGEPGRGPGRVVQELRRVGARNPVIVLDELDRLGDRDGLPTALLELVDAGARTRFRDRYLDVEFDLSGAVILATAAALRPVPAMLRERMAVVELPGYVMDEKKAIAARHLLPTALREHGLAAGDVEFAEGAVDAVVRGYAPEPGLWSLLSVIRTLCRKAARRRAEGDASKAVITPETAAAMLGTPTFIEVDVRERTRAPGVAVGLGWTGYSGDVLFVEAGRMPGAGRLTLTGSLDGEFKESVRTALSWLRANARRYRIDAAVFARTDLHVHVQSVAASNGGVSAGLAVAVALASSFTGRPVRGDSAMTGELTLSGHVLPVGGLQEKVLGAVRRGLTRVVLPRRNLPHYERDVPGDVRSRITVHPVSRVDEAIDLVLGPAPPAVDAAGAVEPAVPRGPADAAAEPAARRGPAAGPDRTGTDPAVPAAGPRLQRGVE